MPPRRDGNVILYRFLWLPTVGFALVGWFFLKYPPLRGWQLALAGCAAFALIYPCYGLITAILLRGKSTSHDRWAKLMGSGVLLIGLGSLGTAAAVNALADPHPLKVRQAEVREKKTKRTGRRGTAYYVSVGGLGFARPDARFPVSLSDFQRITPGRSRLKLTTGDGWLGIPWVKSQPVRP